MDEKLRRQDRVHKWKIDNRTKYWGKNNTKFKPAPFVPEPAVSAKPWQHVKNDIIDDADEANHLEQLDMQSSKAKKFLKIREQNHRRNIIEAKRNEKTSWESFNDETQAKQKVVPQAMLNAKQKDVEDLTFEDRNFFKRKLTKIALNEKQTLKKAIKDLARNGVVRGGVEKTKKKKK